MKILPFFLLLATLAHAAEMPVVPVKHQVWPGTESFDADWLFLPADKAIPAPQPAPNPVAAAPSPAPVTEAPESAWEKISLPHTWNAADTEATTDYRLGVSWYRKHLPVSAGFLARDQRHYIRFGAANQQAQVYVNGQLAAEHAGGYSAFTVEVTQMLVEGDNIIEVKVDNRAVKDLCPTSDGLFNLYGGLYRSATFEHSPRICFSRVVHGGPGARVWSEKATDAMADLNCEVFVDDASADDSREGYTVRAELTDGSGKSVAAQVAPAKAITRISFAGISKPMLWSPENPALYTVTLRLLKQDKEVDRVTLRHGFRSFRFTADEGFFLNGKPYKLHGVNRHQDCAGRGNALLPEHHARDIRLMKDLGVNWLRLAHYQQDDYVLQLCDELGLLVWEEIPFIRGGSLLPGFANNTRGMLTEMIHQHFNHPSIILWGMGNEIGYKKGPDGRATYFTLISGLNDLIHRLDPVRKSVIVNGDANNATDQKIMGIPDVIGYNLYQGWYGGTTDKLTARLEDLHAKNPDKPMILSEFGAGAALGKFTDKPKIFDQSEDYQVYFLREYLRQLDANKWLCGWNWWNFADFAWARSSNPKLFNNKGLVTYDRTPKESYHVLREHLTGVKAPARVLPTAPVAPEANDSAPKVVNPFEVKE